MTASTNAGSAEMLPSFWVMMDLAPPAMSSKSQSAGVSARSCRNRFSGSYQPAFQNRFFSTCSDVKKPSTPPDAEVISTTSFCRAWISGKVSHLIFMPESASNSGMFFSSTSTQGCLDRIRNSSLPWKRFQLKPWARAGVETKGPTAAPATAAAPRPRTARRETGRAEGEGDPVGFARRMVASFGVGLPLALRPGEKLLELLLGLRADGRRRRALDRLLDGHPDDVPVLRDRDDLRQPL